MLLLSVLMLAGCEKSGELISLRKTQKMVYDIRDACVAYMGGAKAGPPAPNGITDSKFVKFLTGNNFYKRAYLKVSAKDLDREGRLVDAWGNPYRVFYNPKGFNLNDDQYVLPDGRVIRGYAFIWSDGPNRKNEGGYGDDIRSW